MSSDAATLVISVAVAVRLAHNAGLVPRWFAEGLLRRGGSTNALLRLCEQGRDEARHARRFHDASRASECERIARTLDALAAEIQAAGDWPAVVCGATAQALNAFEAVLKILREAHELDEPKTIETSDPDLGIETPTLLRQRPVINDWRATVTASRGACGHWIVTGRIYGDPNLAAGCSVTFSATINPDERRAKGVDREYELGRPARGSPRGAL